MRILVPLLVAMSLPLAPHLAQAQQRATPLVELQTVEAAADAPRRSAFGRVMDVMIASLVEQHAQQSQPPGKRVATRPAPVPAPASDTGSVTPKGAEPKIEVTLGERFALPPAATAVATQARDLPE